MEKNHSKSGNRAWAARLKTGTPPHIRRNVSTQQIMLDVAIALVPACAGAIYYFGISALLLIVVSVLSAVLSEYLWQKIARQRVTVLDFSAVVTGILLALNVPATAPLWTVAVGSAFAILVVKQLFGGVGQNFINPALGGRAFLVLCWPALVSRFVAPGSMTITSLQSLLTGTVDAVSSATPLAQIAQGQAPSYLNLFTGNIAGSMGETSAMLILLGAFYMFYRGVIRMHIPLAYIGTVAVLSWVFGGNGFLTGDPIASILSGGLMLGAFFMATDYATTPATRAGQYIFGFGAGILTSVIRLWGDYPEGVCYSILIMNAVSPLIERLTLPRVYGTGKKAQTLEISMGGK